MTIMFSLPYPPTSNTLFPGKQQRHTSKRYDAWKYEAARMVPKGRIEGPYKMQIAIDRPDRRGRDLGNLEKAIGDLIVKAELVIDDRYLDRLEMWWTKREPGKGAMAHVWLSPVVTP